MRAVRKIIEHAERSITIELPQELRNKKIEIIILVAEEVTGKEPTLAMQQKYDFSDFDGTLNWQGDAITEQRKLRDEWK